MLGDNIWCDETVQMLIQMFIACTSYADLYHTDHIQLPWQVCGAQHKDEGRGGCEAVHLYEQLCLHPPACFMLPLATACTHQRIKLVKEDGAGGVVTC